MQISTKSALEKLKSTDAKFLELFRYDSLSVEIYKPEGKDLQSPHTKDEAYIIVEGNGTFNLNGKITQFTKGDFYFCSCTYRTSLRNFLRRFFNLGLVFWGREVIGNVVDKSFFHQLYLNR
jgi:mannose-6-phosphate isomerase-like protein (cupin superfamily)